MHAQSLRDLAPVLLFAIAPLACTLDVGDALSATDSLTTIASGPAGDTGDDETSDASDGGAGPGATGATDAGPVTSTGGGAEPGADTSGGTDDAVDTDGGFGTDGDDSGGDGEVAPACLDWGAHAEQCGFGSDAADYCQLDLEIGAITSAECLAALEQYYVCLGSTDCTTLAEQSETACGRQEAIATCGFEAA